MARFRAFSSCSQWVTPSPSQCDFTISHIHHLWKQKNSQRVCYFWFQTKAVRLSCKLLWVELVQLSHLGLCVSLWPAGATSSPPSPRQQCPSPQERLGFGCLATCSELGLCRSWPIPACQESAAAQTGECSSQNFRTGTCSYGVSKQNNAFCLQLHLRDDHLRDGAAGRGYWVCHHSLLSQEDRQSRPTCVCCQHAGLGHLHLPHLCGGQEEHLRSLCKVQLLHVFHFIQTVDKVQFKTCINQKFTKEHSVAALLVNV